MDGKELLYAVQQQLNEDDIGQFLDEYTTYRFLWQGAQEFVRRTKSLTTTQTITTVADQTDYTLNADFMMLYLKDRSNCFYLQYNDGTTTHNLFEQDYENIIFDNDTISVTIPSEFTIHDDATLDSRISGTTTSTGAVTLGETTLTDTAADFSDVSAGDVVHNIADGSDGVVLSKTSSTVLVTSLFNGTENDWTSGDNYVIQPQGRLKLILNPPPSTTGHTITVHYIQKPAPVFSIYGVYRFAQQGSEALVKYTSWLYKYRDREPNFADTLFVAWDREVRHQAEAYNSALRRKGTPVNMRARYKNGRR